MDQFISTYQKDYTWPSTRIKRTTGLLSEEDSCKCHDRPREIKPLKRCGDDYDWSRTGPMGRLSDPKLYLAKTGPHSETEATKFDQPSTYMRKLEEKYPNLYGILQSIPMDEVIKRVDEDRLKTTYRVDYSDKAATQIEISMGSCAMKLQQEQPDSCVAKRDQQDTYKENQKKKSKKSAEWESQETRLPPWRSEYQDNISRVGQAIMKHKIHQK